jgi:hypothetical protein
VEFGGSVPIGNRCSATMLFSLERGYVHGMIDRWVLLQPSEAGHELCRGRVQPADVLEQEGHHSLHVLWVIGGTSILVFLEGVLDLLGELGELFLLRGHEKRHRGWTGGEDDVLETLGFGHSELCREHSSPRIPQKIEIVLDFEVFEEVVEFGDEELDGPELDVTLLFGDMGRHSAADLVVEDDGDLVLGPEVGEGEHVIVNDTWTSMEDNQGSVFLVGEVTVDLVPGLGSLPGARHDEIDLAGGEAFSGHGSSRGEMVGEFANRWLAFGKIPAALQEHWDTHWN